MAPPALPTVPACRMGRCPGSLPSFRSGTCWQQRRCAPGSAELVCAPRHLHAAGALSRTEVSRGSACACGVRRRRSRVSTCSSRLAATVPAVIDSGLWGAICMARYPDLSRAVGYVRARQYVDEVLAPHAGAGKEGQGPASASSRHGGLLHVVGVAAAAGRLTDIPFSGRVPEPWQWHVRSCLHKW